MKMVMCVVGRTGSEAGLFLQIFRLLNLVVIVTFEF